ncbi:hypothetical protein Bbelb_288880 [Branchiostoma belcheri]|nr:hypothetical protein Bbelb_288880 [Branchiostoma belcheri]
MRTSYTNNVEREVCKRWRGSVVLKVRQTGGVVVDWYAIDIGEGDVTFAQLYERLVAASEYRPDRRPFQSGHHTFERNGSCVEVAFKFGCFVRIVVDKTATTKAKDCQQKSAFEGPWALSCSAPVEVYSARVKSRALAILPLVCWQCGETDTLPIPPEKLQCFRAFIQCARWVCKATRVEERTRVKRKLERKGSREEEDGPLTFSQEDSLRQGQLEGRLQRETVPAHRLPCVRDGNACVLPGEKTAKEEAAKEEAVKEDET